MLFVLYLANNHKLLFHHIYDDNVLPLQRYDSYNYDNVILLCPTAHEYNEHIHNNDLISFVDTGHNIFVILDNNITEPYHQLAYEYDIIINNNNVVDTFNTVKSQYTNQDNIITVKPNNNNIIQIDDNIPLVYSGITHSQPYTINQQFIPILSVNSSSSIISDGINDNDLLLNTEQYIVSGIQTESNGRITFVSNSNLLSNYYYSLNSFTTTNHQHYPHNNNYLFSQQLISWSFGHSNILRGSNLQHKQLDFETSLIPYKRNVITDFVSYRINDWIDISVQIDEKKNNYYVPYISNDVQLQLIMYDPYYRVFMNHTHSGIYNAKIKLPHIFGVYKIVIDYHKQGYNHLFMNETISVRPYRHDEYERFIFVASPYYITVLSLGLAFFVFTVVFLYQKQDDSIDTVTTSTTTTTHKPKVA